MWESNSTNLIMINDGIHFMTTFDYVITITRIY